MATYSLQTIAPPTISLQFHTFRFRVYRQEIGEAGPWLSAIGELTFQKPAQESWTDARDRFIAAVYAWIATYEQAQTINQAISTWLQTQQWQTP